MSIWQFNAAVKGYVKANSASDPKKFNSEDEIEDMFEWLLSQETPVDVVGNSYVYIWDGYVFDLQRVVSFKIKE